MITGGLLLAVGLPMWLFAGSDEVIKKEIPLKKEKSLEVNMEMGLANLEVFAGDPATLVFARVEYDPEKVKPVIDYQEGVKGVLEIESLKKHRAKAGDFNKGDNDWQFAFSGRVPIDINLDLGLGEGDLDFSDLQISGLSVDAGLSELTITFNRPNKERIKKFSIDSGLGEFTAKGLLNANIESFQFSGGLGESTLCFTGKMQNSTEAKIEVGLGSVEILLEEGTPVKVYYEKSFLSSLDLQYFRKIEDNVYVSRNWDENAKNILIIDLEIGLGSVTIDWGCKDGQ